MGRKILIALAAIGAVLAIAIALQPSTFAIERSIEIAAPPEVVFTHLDSPRAMDAWSPWNKIDPQQKITHEGPESGVGAAESWDGPQIGAGRLTITGVKPNEEVEMRLEFTRPMHVTNRALYELASVGDATRVTWRMEGTNNFVGKAASLVMDMDETVGGTFERGLADLKALAEADAVQRADREATMRAAPAKTFTEPESGIGVPATEPAPPAEPLTPPGE